jgi:hypothetical protein
VPAQAAAAAARSPSRSLVRAVTASTAAERPRREWSEGLKRFIAGQRGGTAATQVRVCQSAEQRRSTLTVTHATPVRCCRHSVCAWRRP